MEVIAEIGNTHDGSLGNCHAFIDAAADCGVDWVKFQAHISDVESTDDEGFPKRFQFHPQDKSRADYWRRMEIAEEDWLALSIRANSRGLRFMASVFSISGFERVRSCADAIKIPSGEVNHTRLLNHVSDYCTVPIYLSTGMSGTDEIAQAVEILWRADRRLTLMQCTTEYPTNPGMVGLNMIREFKASYQQCDVGFSDHSGTIWPAVACAALRAACCEVHLCWHPQQFGADISSSVTPSELTQLCDGVRFINECHANPVYKDQIVLSDAKVYREGKRRCRGGVSVSV